jgi:menaquinone-dependent protoporphyrinogen oxidase
MKLLIVYATTEGHTRIISERITELALSNNIEVDLIDIVAYNQPLTKSWDTIIVGGSVHQGHHQMSLRAFVLDNLELLNRVYSAFFSVSLSAAVKDDMHQEEAHGYVTTFLHEVGWQPKITACFAGALTYSEYDYFKLMVLRLLARQVGSGIVQPHDVSYTDWQAVEAFVKTVLEYDAKQT